MKRSHRSLWLLFVFLVSPGKSALAQQTGALVRRNVVVRISTYSGTDSLHWSDGFKVPATSKPEDRLRSYLEQQVTAWGYVTEERLHGQTSACMVVSTQCDPVGPSRDFDWANVKNVDVVVYVRYKGASSVPASIDIDFVSSKRAGWTSDHWREHASVHHWDKDLQRSLDKLHKRMDSGN
jgi:hypothetical protein